MIYQILTFMHLYNSEILTFMQIKFLDTDTYANKILRL